MKTRLTLHHLEAFVRVARENSFRKAAQALNVSQPALSRTIKAAEDAVSVRLFDRDTRNVRLTPAGHELLSIASRILSEFDSSLGDLAEFLAGRRGRIVLATIPSIGASVLPGAISAFNKLNPAVEFSVHAINAEPLLESVRSRVADFGISMQPPMDEQINYEHLLEDEFVLLCPTGHPLSRQKTCRWLDFKDYPLISQSGSSSIRMLAASVFQKLNVTVPHSHECSSLYLTGKLVAAGLGIAALPTLVLSQLDPTGIEVRKLREPVLSRRLGIVTLAGRSLSKASRDFLRMFKEQARKTQRLNRQNSKQMVGTSD